MKVGTLYRHLWAALEPGDFAAMDDLEPPRGPDWIFELADGIGLPRGARILDLACGLAEQAAALAGRYGARAVAVDLVLAQLAEARGVAGERGVRLAAGAMEAIPLADASIDLVWLRDALMHSGDPERALGDCCRVLRPGGHLLLYTASATARLAAHELELLESDMGVHRASLDAARVDAAAAAAGLESVRTEVIGGELAEHYELENGLGSRALRRLALLNRRPEAVRERWGEERLRIARGLYHWVVFELLGKLSYRASLLRKPR